MAQYYEVLSQGDTSNVNQVGTFFNGNENGPVRYIITEDTAQQFQPQQLLVSGDQVMLVDGQQQIQQVVLDPNQIAYQTNQDSQPQYSLIQNAVVKTQGQQQMYYMEGASSQTNNIVIEQPVMQQPNQATPSSSQQVTQPIVLNHQLNSNGPIIRTAKVTQQVQGNMGQNRAPIRQPQIQIMQQRQQAQTTPRIVTPMNHQQTSTSPSDQQVPNVQVRSPLSTPNVNQPPPLQNVTRPLRPHMSAGGVHLVRTALHLQQQGVRLVLNQQQQKVPVGQMNNRQVPMQAQQAQQQQPVIKQLPKTVTEYAQQMKRPEENAVALPDGTTVPLHVYKKMIDQKKVMAQRVADQQSKASAAGPSPSPGPNSPAGAQLVPNMKQQQQRMPRPAAPLRRNARPPAPRIVRTPGAAPRAGVPFGPPQQQQQGPPPRNMTPRYLVNSQQQQQHNQQPQQVNQQQPSTLPFQNKLMQQQQLQEQLRQQQQQQQLQQQQNPQNNYVIGPTQASRQQAQRPLAAYIASKRIQQIIENSHVAEEFSNSIRMLVLLENGEQRLITFTLPKEACTIQEILEQVNVPYNQDTKIQVTEANANGINYIVTVGNVPNLWFHNEGDENQEQEAADSPRAAYQAPLTPPLEEPPSPQLPLQCVPNASPKPSPSSSPFIGPQLPAAVPAQHSPEADPPKPQTPEPPAKPPSPEPPKELPRLVPGKLAVCSYCGITSEDFNRCTRCKTKLPDNIKSIDAPIKSRLSAELTRVMNAQIQANLNGNTPSSKTPVTNNPPAKSTSGPKKKATKPKIVEHDSVVISSDEEEDDKKNIKMVSESLLKSLGASVTISPVSKEPTLLDMKKYVRRVAPEQDSAKFFGLTIKCRTIRVGSYRFAPLEDAILNSKFISFKAPQFDNATTVQTIKIEKSDIVKVLVSFNKALPVVFYYVNPAIAPNIRTMLNLKENSDIYNFDPLSEKEDSFRRITLLPEDFGEEHKNIFLQMYGGPPYNIMDELTPKEANEILIKTCPKEGNTSTFGNYTQIQQILTYPPEGMGRLTINTEDYVCLAQDQFLNDVIIDFYLKYLVHNLSEDEQKKVHVFSTFFYKRLTTKTSLKSSKKLHPTPTELDPALTPAQKRHARVKKWTKNVNLFEKDYIVVPINENAHWFLAIICFPSLDGCQTFDGKPYKVEAKVHPGKKAKKDKPIMCEEPEGSDKDEAEGDDSELDSDGSDEVSSSQGSSVPSTPVKSSKKEPRPPIRQPCILIFDSLAGAARTRVVATLRDYLTCEYKVKMEKEKVYTKDVIKGACPKVPQQTNFTDCGLYLLQYVEEFFKNPIKDFHLPIMSIKHWFEEIIVTKKREDIANLLKKLMQENGKDINILPDIAFPTLNGKLVERVEPAKEEAEEEDMFTDIEDSEMMEPEQSDKQNTSLASTVSDDSITPSDTTFSSQAELINSTPLRSKKSPTEELDAQESPIKPSVEGPGSEFVVAQSVPPPRPDVSEMPKLVAPSVMRQSNRDTLALLKAKRIVRHKNADGPEAKKSKNE